MTAQARTGKLTEDQIAAEKAALDRSVMHQGGEWETTVEEYGDNLDLTNGWEGTDNTFVGRYDKVTVVELPNPDTGELRPTNVYRLVDAQGKVWSLWGSFNIDKGMQTVPLGNQVRIQYMNTAKLDGGRTVKEYRIAHRSTVSS